MTGQCQHHSTAWHAPPQARPAHAKIRNWPALRENHRCISSSSDVCPRSQRVEVEYGERRREGEAWMRQEKQRQTRAFDATSLRGGEPPNAGVSSMSKTDIQDESNFSPGEINQL